MSSHSFTHAHIQFNSFENLIARTGNQSTPAPAPPAETPALFVPLVPGPAPSTAAFCSPPAADFRECVD